MQDRVSGRLLLIEDEAPLRRLIAEAFTREGFEVDTAPSGEAGLDSAAERDYDLIILDIGLPGIDGFGVIKALRERGCEIPLVVLTSMDAEEGLVRSLELGADNFFRKPFPMRMLLAHVRALLRRSNESRGYTLTFGDLYLDIEKRVATRGGKPLILTETQFKLLTVLVQARGGVVPRDQLLREVWGISFNPGTNVIDVQLSYLRTKLGELGPPIIASVRGVGYKLVTPSEG